MRNDNKGFTLIEVLIVIVIIAIMASLSVPRFMGQSERAKVSEAVNTLGVLRRAALSYFDQKGYWPPSTTDQSQLASYLEINIPASNFSWDYEGENSGNEYIISANYGKNYISLSVVTGTWSGGGTYGSGGSLSYLLPEYGSGGTKANNS